MQYFNRTPFSVDVRDRVGTAAKDRLVIDKADVYCQRTLASTSPSVVAALIAQARYMEDQLRLTEDRIADIYERMTIPELDTPSIREKAQRLEAEARLIEAKVWAYNRQLRAWMLTDGPTSSPWEEDRAKTGEALCLDIAWMLIEGDRDAASFNDQKEVFLAEAGRKIDASSATARGILVREGLYIAGKQGAAGLGLQEMIDGIRRYYRMHHGITEEMIENAGRQGWKIDPGSNELQRVR